ncbi:hypothetical protein ABZ912_26890 [Nonomuraea angiospora]|uniref:hypothetical protein n=1 Tax=Nonomuraea angiospora TaxID=46172 RepID=UPI00340793BD
MERPLRVARAATCVYFILCGILMGTWVVFGFGHGCLDVSMNAHAVHVEKAYNRPVMSAFHAMFSIGGVIAALLAAGAAGAGTSPAATLGATGAVGIVIALVSARALLPAAPASAAATTPAEGETEPAAQRRDGPGRIWIITVLALMIMLCEGAANDWSALHLKNVLGAPAGTAAIG